jgi:hypothetical protein
LFDELVFKLGRLFFALQIREAFPGEQDVLPNRLGQEGGPPKMLYRQSACVFRRTCISFEKGVYCSTFVGSCSHSTEIYFASPQDRKGRPGKVVRLKAYVHLKLSVFAWKTFCTPDMPNTWHVAVVAS